MTNQLRPWPTFVMPYYAWRQRDLSYLDGAIEGLLAQTDENWQVIIVDDASPLKQSYDHLQSVCERLRGRVLLVSETVNRGAGYCRNAAIEHARRAGAPFVLFHDSDDVSHPDRLRTVRQIFADDSKVAVIYSTFSVIDENSMGVDVASLTPSIQEILEAHEVDPPSGSGTDVLIQVATRTGYATLTSTVAARVEIAVKHPFPVERVSEDSHTWFRYAAAADLFVYVSTIPARYRIPRDCEGSSVRKRVGASFYAEKARVEAEGFVLALNIAVARGRLEESRRAELLAGFHARLAVTMRREGETALAEMLFAKATSFQGLSAVHAQPLM
jgi:glycosyltransferase involved in cell wall biosynthesis